MDDLWPVFTFVPFSIQNNNPCSKSSFNDHHDVSSSPPPDRFRWRRRLSAVAQAPSSLPPCLHLYCSQQVCLYAQHPPNSTFATSPITPTSAGDENAAITPPAVDRSHHLLISKTDTPTISLPRPLIESGEPVPKKKLHLPPRKRQNNNTFNLKTQLTPLTTAFPKPAPNTPAICVNPGQGDESGEDESVGGAGRSGGGLWWNRSSLPSPATSPSPLSPYPTSSRRHSHSAPFDLLLNLTDLRGGDYGYYGSACHRDSSSSSSWSRRGSAGGSYNHGTGSYWVKRVHVQSDLDQLIPVDEYSEGEDAEGGGNYLWSYESKISDIKTVLSSWRNWSGGEVGEVAPSPAVGATATGEDAAEEATRASGLVSWKDRWWSSGNPLTNTRIRSVFFWAGGERESATESAMEAVATVPEIHADTANASTASCGDIPGAMDTMDFASEKQDSKDSEEPLKRTRSPVFPGDEEDAETTAVNAAAVRKIQKLVRENLNNAEDTSASHSRASSVVIIPVEVVDEVNASPVSVPDHEWVVEDGIFKMQQEEEEEEDSAWELL
ncbi:hypothetical protein HK102_003243 [Quaeritorhiza haematococci]|nr:hypothetical protein HK102_003243 [Quaeritorhiza haematococci]